MNTSNIANTPTKALMISSICLEHQVPQAFDECIARFNAANTKAIVSSIQHQTAAIVTGQYSRDVQILLTVVFMFTIEPD